MSEPNWQKIESIVDIALELPEDARNQAIDRMCANDKQLKGEVTMLLESISLSEGWLENPQKYKEDFYEEIARDIEKLGNSKSLLGYQVGAYTIKEKLGEGGMGRVYRALRSDGTFEHQVAIKVIRDNHTTPDNIRRFEQERNILAGLNHPGIAKLFDGGVTDKGIPYLIMEYIDGQRIDHYCQEHQLSLTERVELFKKVLKAVQHAHENLVIHRDLKPSNILVTANREIKILDFGISKLLKESESNESHQTVTKGFLLTPRYAAPEQIREESITTATDIFALGTIFYQLLTGNHPLGLEEKLSHFQIGRLVLEQSSLPLTSNRSASHVIKEKQLRGDISAIALKAIRKEPNHRYRTAKDFLDDLNKYEQGLPVSARSDSLKYRSKKFIKRHKEIIAAVVLFLMSITTLTGFYTYQLKREQKTAEAEAQKALEVKNLLINLFEANDPISTDDEQAVTLAQLLDTGFNRLIDRKINPEVKSELLLTLATIHKNITEYEKARELAEESLQLNLKHFKSPSIEVAKSYIELGKIEHSLGNFEKGKTYFAQALNALQSQGSESPPLLAKVYNHLGNSDEQLSNYDSSESYYEQSLNLYNTYTDTDTAEYIGILRDVARSNYLSHYPSKNIPQADSLLLLALDLSKNFHGKNHIITSSVMNDIGMFYMTQARYNESRKYYNRSLAIKNIVYGEKSHPNYSSTLNNLAVLEKTLSNFTTAESLYIETLEMDRELFGEDHPNVAISKNNLATIYFETGDFDKSRKFRDDALNMYLELYGPDHYYLGSMYRNYGELLSVQQEYNLAEEYFVKADSIYADYISTDHSNYAKLFESRAQNYYRKRNYNSSALYFERAAKSYDALNPKYYIWMAAECTIKMGKSYLAMHQEEKAKSIFQDVKTRIDTTKALANNSKIQELFSKRFEDL